MFLEIIIQNLILIINIASNFNIFICKNITPNSIKQM